MTILLNAYACAPNKGSELGLGWNWIINLANYCKIHVITEGEFRSEIEEALSYLPQRKNINFYYNPVPSNVRKMCWNQGDWRFYWYYRNWQKSTLKIAQKIIKEHQIDIIHQFNMIGFREPGYLWNIKGIPHIWGPFNIKAPFPSSFLVQASLPTKVKTILKDVITEFQLRFAYRISKAMHSSQLLLGASSESVAAVKKYFRKDAILMNETGTTILNDCADEIIPESYSQRVKILWIGKFDFGKQLILALKVLSMLPKYSAELIVVGGTSNQIDVYKKLSTDLGLEGLITWTGVISHQEVQTQIRNSNLLLFTSLSEGTPHVVLEAISNGLPVVCFDCCGQGDVVNENVGRKIKVTSPDVAVQDFVKQIKDLIENPNLLRNLSEGCMQYRDELTWDSKAKKMVELYKSLVITK